MARSASSIVLTIIAALVALLGMATAVFGPTLYREGRALVGPIASLATAQGAFGELNQEFPFEPPGDGIVREDRLLVFLELWEELHGHYVRWQELADATEGSRDRSWEEAKEVLGATEDVHRQQLQALRSHRMSPTELLWLEDLVFYQWWQRVERELEESQRPTIARELRRTGTADLEFVESLEVRHGPSPALASVKRRLEDRLASLSEPERPEVADVPRENQNLFWQQRERIAAIGLPVRYPLHDIVRDQAPVILPDRVIVTEAPEE